MKDSSARIKQGGGDLMGDGGGVRGFLMDHDEFQYHPLTLESWSEYQGRRLSYQSHESMFHAT